MNYSKFFVLCLFSAVLAFAQLPWETPSQGASDASSPVPAPSSFSAPPAAVASPPPASAPSGEKTAFDKLRGNGYNRYGTIGAATTVDDLYLYPSEIHGQKFFYVSPQEDYAGYAAFGLGGGSALFGLDNSPLGNRAALVLGYATSAFGVAATYSVAKSWFTDKETPTVKEGPNGQQVLDTVTSSRRTTFPGDNLGLSFSLPLGGSATLYANAHWLTYATSYSYEVDSKEIKEDYSRLGGAVGAFGAFGALNYDVSLQATRFGGTLTDDKGNKAVDEDTYLGFGLGLNLGYVALQNSEARAIVGLNNYVGMNFYDEVKKIEGREGYSEIGAIISPNVLGEVVFFENWLAFAGAMHNLYVLALDEDRNKETSQVDLVHDESTEAYVGVRYQKASWALEAQVSANPFRALNGDNIFASFGGFIYF